MGIERFGYNLLISNNFLPSKLLFYTLNLSSQLETDRFFSFRISARTLVTALSLATFSQLQYSVAWFCG